ncbi:hypothetical protein ACWGKK_16070 [Streptomyces chartreusis]
MHVEEVSEDGCGEIESQRDASGVADCRDLDVVPVELVSEGSRMGRPARYPAGEEELSGANGSAYSRSIARRVGKLKHKLSQPWWKSDGFISRHEIDAVIPAVEIFQPQLQNTLDRDAEEQNQGAGDSNVDWEIDVVETAPEQLGVPVFIDELHGMSIAGSRNRDRANDAAADRPVQEAANGVSLAGSGDEPAVDVLLAQCVERLLI